jgi:hypothetical protein
MAPQDNIAQRGEESRKSRGVICTILIDVCKYLKIQSNHCRGRPRRTCHNPRGSSVSTSLDSLERAQSNETAAPPTPYDQHGPEHKILSPPSHSSDHNEGGAGYPAQASVEEWKALDEECGHAGAMDQCRYATAFETW